MTIKTIFETCRPRADVLHGTVAEADLAADLAQVVTGQGSQEYVDPARFFSKSYPTRGLRNLLADVGTGAVPTARWSKGCNVLATRKGRSRGYVRY